VADFPEHPILRAIAQHVEKVGMSVTIADHEMNLIWMSSEGLRIFGPGITRYYGKHYLHFGWSPELIGRSTERSILRAGLSWVPMYIDKTPGGREAVRALLESIVGPGSGAIVDQVPDHQDPMWSMTMKLSPAEGMEHVLTSAIVTEVYDRDGGYVGAVAIFGAALPARLVNFLARGDVAALERMVKLTTPGRRSAAILFADVQSSGTLSRRLPSAVYFRLVRSLITAIDIVVIGHDGIVGRHAGDGATAFFLTEDSGSASSAARAAIAAARDIGNAVRDTAEGVETETGGLVTAKECTINIGLHWGGSLYMGQLNTGGRLEVTALGDAVNECARIQESARDGEILVSKALIENLDADAAAALAIDPDVL
jgi:class 3 adenylate cyclase